MPGGPTAGHFLQPARSRRSLAVLAIEHVPDHFAPLFIYFVQRFAFLGAHAVLVCSLFSFRRTALRTAIRKSRFIGPQFELFSAYNAGFDWKTHPEYFIETRVSAWQIKIDFLKSVLDISSEFRN